MSDVIDHFVVSTINEDGPTQAVQTWVSHQHSTRLGTDIVRIEQETVDRDDRSDNDVVVMTRADFERIAKILKGH